jgi:hypothetical protein
MPIAPNKFVLLLHAYTLHKKYASRRARRPQILTVRHHDCGAQERSTLQELLAGEAYVRYKDIIAQRKNVHGRGA